MAVTILKKTLTCNTCSLSQIFLILRLCWTQSSRPQGEVFWCRNWFWEQSALCCSLSWGRACRSHALSLTVPCPCSWESSWDSWFLPAAWTWWSWRTRARACASARSWPLQVTLTAGSPWQCWALLCEGTGVLKRLLRISSCGEDFLITKQTPPQLYHSADLSTGGLVGAQLLWVVLPHCLCRETSWFLFKLIRKSSELGKAVKFLLSAA